jgi:hypothetical protein
MRRARLSSSYYILGSICFSSKANYDWHETSPMIHLMVITPPNWFLWLKFTESRPTICYARYYLLALAFSLSAMRLSVMGNTS